MRLTYCFAICLIQIISYANFVQPCDIKLETKEIISRKDTDVLHIVVTGTNDDGTQCNGEAYMYLYITQEYNHIERKRIDCGFVDMVNGKAEYDLNMTEVDFPKYNTVNKNIFLGTQVSDTNFNAWRIRTFDVKVYSNRYNLNRCVSGNTCSNYIPNLEQDVVYHITHVDGSAVIDTKSIVELTYADMMDIHESNYSFSESPSGNKPLTFTGHMNETGFVHFKVTLPEFKECTDCTLYFVKTLKYLDEESKFSRVHVESDS